MTTIAVKVFLGWIILIGGLVTAFHAFSTQKWSAFFYNLMVGVLYVLVGGWLAFLPLTGVITLTVMLATLFIVQGVVQAALAFQLRPRDGWMWILVAGIIAIVAGFMLITGLPSTATWAIGLPGRGQHDLDRLGLSLDRAARGPGQDATGRATNASGLICRANSELGGKPTCVLRTKSR